MPVRTLCASHAGASDAAQRVSAALLAAYAGRAQGADERSHPVVRTGRRGESWTFTVMMSKV